MLLSLLSVVGLAVACADNERHAHGKREYPQVPLTPPHLPLVWGDFNVIHTTDTHGWLLGHQKLSWPEPNYRRASPSFCDAPSAVLVDGAQTDVFLSGDLGDFASFVMHMKQIAIEKDVDLLLVDSGDLHDGTGLSDGYPSGGVDAHESNKFLERLPYDVMSIGNHELYIYADTYDMYTNFVPQLNGRYLSSNANITVIDSNGEAVSVPIGNRYVKFTTGKGRKVTSLGVLYDFKGNSANTTVQNVADMVNEQWFADAIADEPDVFLLVGHMPVSYDKWPVVFNAVRAVHPYTPIMIFGGHSHIRDCQQYDGRSMALESGRYMETIGWMSADLDASKGNTDDITFTRRYLDQNRVTYQYHTMTSNSTFDTTEGLDITSGLQQLAVDFDLSYFYGTAPQDYTINQDPYPSDGNALTLYIAQAAPVALAINNPRAGTPNLIITNSDQVRYNIFGGPFTQNDQLTASPFVDSFLYIPDVAVSIANEVLSVLNAGGSSSKRAEVEEELWGRGHVERRYRAWLEEMSNRQVAVRTADDDDGKLTLGYVTKDGCPGDGDDTRHAELTYHRVPNYVASDAPTTTTTTTNGDAPIDLVFVDFIESALLRALNDAVSEAGANATSTGTGTGTTATATATVRRYTTADVLPYTSTLTNAVLGLYARSAWN